MKHSIYLSAKQTLVNEAKEAKRLTSKSDKPYIRQCINDQADQMHRQIDHYAMKGNYSNKVAEMYKNWLSSLACNLHP